MVVASRKKQSWFGASALHSSSMSSAPPRLSVGSVPYLVGRPLDFELEHEPRIDFVRQVPAQLVAGLRTGELDVALVSSIELFRQPGYRYLERLAVSGRGFVGSVQLFLRKPIEAVRRVALDPASRTAATLVQVLLADRPEGPIEFIDVKPETDPRAVEADGWLRIGDAALREYLTEDLPVYNPSQEWTRSTGLPFVFAPWIVRPGVPIEDFLDVFTTAYERGRERIDDLARAASVQWHVATEACQHYLAEECIYDLEEDMHASLLAFRDRAAPLGLCDAGFEPEPIRLPSLTCPG